MSRWTCIEDILTLAQQPQYQDVTLVCNNGSITLNSVILASLSPVIRNAMNSLPIRDPDEMISIIFYDVNIEEIRQLFNSILNKTEEISSGNSVFEFMKQLKIQVKSEEILPDQLKAEALHGYGDKDHKETKDLNQELQYKTTISHDEIKMNLDELIDELDPLSESEEENYQMSKTSFCKIEPGSNVQNNRNITCSKCGKTVSRKNIARHLKSFCTSSLLKCNLCEFTSFNQPVFKKHVDKCESEKTKNDKKIDKSKVPEVEKPFVCEICSFSSKLKWGLLRHIRHVHADQSGLKKCEKCKTLFIESEFDDHTCVMFSCEICGREFGNQKYLRDHVDKHHYKKDLSSCEICGKLVKIGGMKRHIESYHMPDLKIPCHICGKKLRSENQLKEHIRHHSKEKELCTICNKKVHQLKRHMISVHTRDEDKRYQCEDCGKGFEFKHNLKHHRMNMHIKSRPYECRYGCKFAYNDKSNRNAHERKTHGKLFDEQDDEASK